MKKLVKQSWRYTQKRWKDILNCEEEIKNETKKFKDSRYKLEPRYYNFTGFGHLRRQCTVSERFEVKKSIKEVG